MNIVEAFKIIDAGGLVRLPSWYKGLMLAKDRHGSYQYATIDPDTSEATFYVPMMGGYVEVKDINILAVASDEWEEVTDIKWSEGWFD